MKKLDFIDFIGIVLGLLMSPFIIIFVWHVMDKLFSS